MQIRKCSVGQEVRMKYTKSGQAQSFDIGSMFLTDEKQSYKDNDVIIFIDVRRLAQIFYGADDETMLRPEMNIALYCYKGKLTFDVNGQNLTVNNGQMFICPPNMILSDFMFSANVECLVMCFTTRLLQESLRDDFSEWNKGVYVDKVMILNATADDQQLLKSYCDVLVNRVKHPETVYHKRILHSIVQATLLEICERIRREKSVGTTAIEKHDNVRSPQQSRILFDQFLAILNAEPQKRHPVEYYAEKLYISPKYLTVICKRESNKTALEWIQEYVIEDVRCHLSTPDLTIKESAEQCGFSTLTHFGRFVREHFGCSPREYRKKLRKQ